MRRTLATVVVAAALAALPPTSVVASPKKDALPADLKFYVVGETITDAFSTGNDKWFHVNDAYIETVGFGTLGDEAVVFTGSATGKSHTSIPADPSLPPGFGDEGWAHVFPAHADFVTLNSGRTFACDGWFHLERAPGDFPFPFAYDDGMSKWKCDDGRRVDLAVRGYWEIDPVSGVPVFAIELTGTIR